MSIHYFESTGEAYDACNCDETVKQGDTVVVASERVVGLAWAWPVAVTKEHGHFHTVKEGGSLEGLENHEGGRVFSNQQINLALAVAYNLLQRGGDLSEEELTSLSEEMVDKFERRSVNLMDALKRSIER